ncbi:phytoene desaturase family protein [Moheibacter sediminis]|uniref:All-trans-retinol 13,14-reductase n=1 Tax=Moheibacter sediminis TaxID=1434700 RepID=A0A1W1Y6C4_9FLAO|nr:NAD(P)-binding protein [Moheibacter sediminis]SMC31684.1 all-trans-retinol 13,14-reductase [Moheibacter sediminis]
MQEEFDIIIIGSGLGGLVCANILCREGYKVLVLEKNQQFGGNLQTFSRDKVVFDTGVHYIGALLPGQNLHKYFHYLGIADQLKIQQMDLDGFDLVTFDEDENEYPYAQGTENFVHQLSLFFPEEKESIRRYVSKMKEVCDSFPLYRLDADVDYLSKEEIIPLKASEIINSITENEKLRAILAGTNFLYAGIKDKTPFYVHALSINSYIESSWRCLNGGSQISKQLIKQIRNLGGSVLKHKEVDSFEIKDGEVEAVTTKDGFTYKGKQFISNIDPKKTMSLIKGFPIRKSYLRRIKESEDTISSFSLYITLKPESFPYLNKNYYHYKNESKVWDSINYKPENWPESYMVSFNTKNENDIWTDGISVLTYMRYEEVKQWENSFNTVAEKDYRGDEYEKFKAEKTEILLNELEKKFPNLRECILSTYVATPLTYRDYIGSETGCMYGFVKDANSPLKTYLSPKTKIKNLFLTGQSINMHGILGVTISAVLTCSEFVGRKELLDNINLAYHQKFNL